jgi:hypothetical protein
VQANTSLVAGSLTPAFDGHTMLSNMSSSDRSSPMHSTKSGAFPVLTMDDRRLSTTTPLLMPCATPKEDIFATC